MSQERLEANASEVYAKAFRLDEMGAIVTGAGSGIGKATTLLMCAAGATVIAADIDEGTAEQTAGEARRAGGVCYSIRADVSRQEERERLVKEAGRLVGPVRILANVAGVTGRRPALDMSVEGWRRVMAVNLEGCVFLAQLVARQMIEAGLGGAMVNVASIHGIRAGRERTAYAVSKAGIAQLTRNLAVEWAQHGIRVNAVAPGPISTGMTADSLRNPAFAEQLVRKIPMDRLGSPMEVATVMLFLCSPASSYVTGQILAIDGGVLASW